MSDNSIQMNIERIVDIFKEDIKENAESSYLYSYFKPKSSSEIKGDELSEETNNNDKKNDGINKKIYKKTQDFLSTNKLGKTESISAKMLLGLCEHNEKWRTPVAEIFSSSIDIDKDIEALEKLLNERQKDALIPIKIEVNTGATLYIRYRESRKEIGVEYIFYSPLVGEIANVDSNKPTYEVMSKYQTFRIYDDANDTFNEYIYAIETDFENENLNKFHLPEKFQMQYGKFMAEESLDDIMDEHSEKEDTDFEPLM